MGTAEEIEHAEGAGKPVHLYFSTAPRPNDIEPSQLQALQDFRREVERRGLLGTFGSPEELTAHVWQAIEHDLGVLDVSGSSTGRTGVDFLVQPGQERLPKIDSRGRIRHETKHWLEVTNRGQVDATQVTVESEAEGVIVAGPTAPTVIHAGQTRRFPVLRTFSSSDPVIRLTWTEEGESKESLFHVG